MPGNLVRLQSNPRDDLSTRADFFYGISRALSDALRNSLESSGLIQEYQDRARIDVRVNPSMTGIEVELTVEPLKEGSISEEEQDQIRERGKAVIRETLKSSMSDAIQDAIAKAKGAVS